MLRKEDSNKILKGIKTVVFSTGLSLLNTINVEAKEITPTQFVRGNGEITPLLVGITLGGTLVISLIGVAIYAHKLSKNNSDCYMTKLEDEQFANEKEAIEHIKIICK